MLAATTSPWYFPTCVRGQMPVMSPIAHRRSPARSRASTGIPRPSASMPTVSRPSAPTPQDAQPGRKGRDAGHLTVGPDALELSQAGNRRHDRVGTGCEDDVVGGVTHTVDLDHSRSGEPAAAAQQVDAFPGQPANLA